MRNHEEQEEDEEADFGRHVKLVFPPRARNFSPTLNVCGARDKRLALEPGLGRFSIPAASRNMS